MPKHFQTMQHTVWLPYSFSVGPVFNRFYEGLKEEKLWANKCTRCNNVLVPPRSFCPACNVEMEEWVEAAQQGDVVSWTVAGYDFYGMPAQPPFVGALIRLDGTDCNFLHMVGGFAVTDFAGKKDRIQKRTRVRAVWSEVKKGHMLDIRYFQPV